ncbi:MAG: cold shock domain-containing protein [bacterium]|nr:cold shock domain-containing protein [bacterium]MDE0605132.1 cold shock domain-containing protein [bacterium]
MSLAGRNIPLIGTVASFDSGTGWGTIAAGDGTAYPFHCTAIADGTRTITAGVAVTFQLAAGHRGVWEAAGITPR